MALNPVITTDSGQPLFETTLNSKEFQTNACITVAMDGGHIKSCVPMYSLKDVAHHCDLESCWIVVSDLHPGGEDIILEHAGTDATVAFVDKGHSRDAYEMLRDYLVGQLVKEDRRPPIRLAGTF
ncbi:cytochrome b5 type B-like isoform X2 [Haliotis rubra]|uniref:cytochrome b5 type B-like isoform X2 n=1 Tax=Haliotis rubra TaxID=36100 RepID=UPI001EE51016|nr:cytochrome b5 type B-like isoform X2 [Haliotis rubra]